MRSPKGRFPKITIVQSGAGQNRKSSRLALGSEKGKDWANCFILSEAQEKKTIGSFSSSLIQLKTKLVKRQKVIKSSC